MLKRQSYFLDLTHAKDALLDRLQVMDFQVHPYKEQYLPQLPIKSE